MRPRVISFVIPNCRNRVQIAYKSASKYFAITLLAENSKCGLRF